MNTTFCGGAHTRLIAKPINNALRIVTRCLHPTPKNNLFILSGIQPIELCCQNAVLSLARRALEPEQLLHERLLSPLCGQLRQLKSRYPFAPTAPKTAKRSRTARHQCSTMDEIEIKPGVVGENRLTTYIY